MKKTLFIVVGAVVAATSFSPAAYAKHKKAKPMMMMEPAMSPTMDGKGEFYATPMSATSVNAPGLATLPGFTEATGVVGGVTAPLLAPIGAAGTLPGLDVIPNGLDAAGGAIDGVTGPLLKPLS